MSLAFYAGNIINAFCASIAYSIMPAQSASPYCYYYVSVFFLSLDDDRVRKIIMILVLQLIVELLCVNSKFINMQ